MIKRGLYIITLTSFLFSCGEEVSNESKFEQAMSHDSTHVTMPEISTDALVEIINSVPPPIEL